MEISQSQIRALAEFRHRIREFLHFSEEAARSAGVEPQQHQLMLAIQAMDPEPASIRDLAERLLLRHHSVVGLVDRMENCGMVRRAQSAQDRRSAHVFLTSKGSKILRKLSLHHREELKSAAPALIESLTYILHETEPKHAKGA